MVDSSDRRDPRDARASGLGPGRSLAALPGPRRLAVALFLVFVLFLYLLAQAKLVLTVARNGIPGPSDVLVRYHGDPARTVLHRVLDPGLAADDPTRMYPYLGASEEECQRRRAQVLAWAVAGAPREGWPAVAPIFQGAQTCGQCHTKKPDDQGAPRAKADLPFDTYEGVVAAARIDSGMSIHELLTSAHNHAFGFATLALLVSWIFTASAWRGRMVPILVLLAFGGALVDIACWFLTKYVGSPFQHGVMLGGGAFGGSVTAMTLLSLDELLLGGRGGALLSRVTGPLGLGRREPLRG